MITEPMLILPALYVIDRYGQVTMTELIEELTWFFSPTGEDAVILSGRNDTKFSQKVRNLRSHRSNNGMADYTDIVGKQYSLTREGRDYLRHSEDYETIDYLFSNRFHAGDVVDVMERTAKVSGRNQITSYQEDEMLEEGRIIRVTTNKRIRSQRLREAAIDHYSDRYGRISCAVCGFTFEDVYGPLGQGFIEIHHERPVCQYSNEGFEDFLSVAVSFVKPVCSNCHRMLHRDKNHPLTIQELQAIVDDNQ